MSYFKGRLPASATTTEAPTPPTQNGSGGPGFEPGCVVTNEAITALGLRAAADARLRGLTERRLAALAEAKRQGLRMGGGDCGYSAVAINRELFKGQGTYVAAYNTALMAKTGDFAGHLVVRFEDQLWDAEGTHAAEDIEAWGMLDPEDTARLTEKGIIEIAPLAYMRGRTLSHCFVVLDEAQNTTPEQMMMFLTRLGEDSRMVVTGDITQIDLPRAKHSGLLEVRHILADIPGIDFHTFSGADVVRHPLVQKIIEAYDHYRNPMNEENGTAEGTEGAVSAGATGGGDGADAGEAIHPDEINYRLRHQVFREVLAWHSNWIILRISCHSAHQCLLERGNTFL